MEQVEYAVGDVFEHILLSIAMALQILAITLILHNCTENVIQYQNGCSRLEKLKNSGAYVNSDSTSSTHIDELYADEENSVIKEQELYRYIKTKEGCDSFTVFSYDNMLSNGYYTTCYYTETAFFENYGLECLVGNYIFEQSEDSTPMVVGYALKEDYQLGKVYSEINIVTGETESYKVIGILKKGSSMPSLYNIGQEISLDYAILQPVDMSELNDFATLDMAISSTVVFTDCQSNLDDIVLKSAELNLFGMNYSSVQKNINEYANTMIDSLKWKILILVVFMLFTGLSLVVLFRNLFENKKYEFAIHMMYGAGRIRVLSRIMYYTLLLSLPAFIVMFLLHGVNFSTVSVMLGMLLLLGVSMIPTWVQLRRLDICQVKLQGERYGKYY